MKSEEQINAEKAAKPRPDLIPGSALLAMGEVMSYGWGKHGDCTWKHAGTEQADPRTHVASAIRHLAEYLDDPDATEEGSGLPVLWHAASQLTIAIDCIQRADAEAANRIQRLGQRVDEAREVEKAASDIWDRVEKARAEYAKANGLKREASAPGSAGRALGKTPRIG